MLVSCAAHLDAGRSLFDCAGRAGRLTPPAGLAPGVSSGPRAGLGDCAIAEGEAKLALVFAAELAVDGLSSLGGIPLGPGILAAL